MNPAPKKNQPSHVQSKDQNRVMKSQFTMFYDHARENTNKTTKDLTIEVRRIIC